METPAPFDLTQQVQAWRGKLAEAAAMSKDQLDELEDHVRTSFAQLQSKGIPAEEAFLIAIRRVGSSRALSREFLKANPQRLAGAYLFRFVTRHRWTLGLCSLSGLLAAGGFLWLHEPRFQSQAALFIRYVMENSTPGLPGGDTKAVSPDRGGETIINTEVEILGSMDLAYSVVDAIGVDKILDKSKGVAKDRDHAALEVRSDLDIRPFPGSGVIRLVFAHGDPTIPQPALDAVVEAYLKKHVEVHRGAGSIGDFLSQETDQLRSRLAQTEDELRKVKYKAGIISLDSAQAAGIQREARIRDQIIAAQTELVEHSAILGALGKIAPSVSGGELNKSSYNLTDETIRVKALQAKIEFLGAQFAEVKSQSDRVSQLEGTIAELQRQRELDETNYRYYSTHLEATRIDEALGSGHALNIATVEAPTAAFIDATATYKLMGALVGGGIGFGLCWAGLNEIFLSRLRRRGGDDDDFSAEDFRPPVRVTLD
jgi:uncharacterized protein involved in exopolysaccharide biosynthesis